MSSLPSQSQPARARIRDVVPGIHLGSWKPGPKNGITDIPGVLVHTQEIHQNDGAVNTGVTTILPRKNWFSTACYAGLFRFNGSGELTGSHWIEETGLLASPIVLTNSFAVGGAYQGIYQWTIRNENDPEYGIGWFLLPVVGETFDGWLNDMSVFAVTPEHICTGIDSATDEPVKEGNRGGGTGMMCLGHKGGTGTSSRVVPGLASRDPRNPAAADPPQREYTIAALVQANFGRLQNLRVAGVPVGRLMAAERGVAGHGNVTEADKAKEKKDGSIIVVLATDAPLHPLQCQRLAKRATVGLARTGGYGANPSGDIFLAFSTANPVPVQTFTSTVQQVDPFRAAPLAVDVVDDTTINALIEAAADATEEAIYNAMCMAETMTGHLGHTVEAIDLDKLKEIMAKYM
jgi:D-aminopeptidase